MMPLPRPQSRYSPLELADTMHSEADQLLADICLEEIMLPIGPITPTGSYYLNVMVYPDIDLYVPRVTVDQLFRVGAQFAHLEQVVQVVFEQGDVSMPGGLYLKLRVAAGNWGRPWKIDVWSLDEAILEQKMAPMRHFLKHLTPELRQRIIQYKLTILTASLRTPVYSGYYIYKAFIDEELTGFDQVTQYLIKNGIQIEQYALDSP